MNPDPAIFTHTVRIAKPDEIRARGFDVATVVSAIRNLIDLEAATLACNLGGLDGLLSRASATRSARIINEAWLARVGDAAAGDWRPAWVEDARASK